MADIKADIQEAVDSFVKATNTEDWEALAKLYTDDCRIMAPDTPVQFGRDAIVAAVRDLIKSGVTHVTLITNDYGGSGDQVWKRGALTGYNKDNKIICTAKDLNIYKRVDGKLCIFVDIWNLDPPPQ